MTLILKSVILPPVKKNTLQVVFILVSKNEVHEKESTKKIDKILELSLLFDFYGELLKENKKQVFEDYISNDLSLGEIATERGISRQGVYDIVKRCSNELVEYEKKLHLVEKFEYTKEKVNRIHEISKDLKENKGNFKDLKNNIEEIEQISNDILQNF